jgi:tetratricopeptide (TPR) repeat protein
MGSFLLQYGLTYKARTYVRECLQIDAWLDSIIRVFLVAVLFLSFGIAITDGVASWSALQATPQGFRNAIRWAPWNAQNYAGLARAIERPLEQENLSEVIRLYEKAARLSSHDAQYRARLAQAYEWAGRREDAQSAYQQALLLSPNSPAIDWVAGNFYLRQGQQEQAMKLLQKAVLLDPELRRAAFDLAWRATENGELIAKEMVPARTDLQFEYLNYLLETQRIDEAIRTWDRAVKRGYSLEPKAAFPYFDALIRFHRIDALQAAWSALMGMSGSRMAAGEAESNLIVNGEFETEILNGGLDWRFIPTPGAAIAIDREAPLRETRSLQINFDGTQNLAYAIVFQYVPVAPNTTYHFSGYMRAQDITTDSGPRFQICDADDPAGLFVQTGGMLQTSPWSMRQLDFRTGPATRLLMVRVARPPSSKFNNRIAGTVWIDRVQLQASP